MSEAKRFYRPGSKRTKEFLLAKTMMVLVLVFLILNTPRLILGLYEVTFNLKIYSSVFPSCFWQTLSVQIPSYNIYIISDGVQREFLSFLLLF